MEYMEELKHLINILAAVVLGAAIGYERKLRYKEAGIRTHIIVCAGSALMMVVSKYGFGEENADASRVAAQIISGIGFLGAGIIIYRKHTVHGLTTAAGIWVTAGVGMAAGAGLYIIAAGATVIIICVQCLSQVEWKFLRRKKEIQLKLSFYGDGNTCEAVKELFAVPCFRHLVMERHDGKTIYNATIHTARKYSSVQLSQIMAEHDFICSIERSDDE